MDIALYSPAFYQWLSANISELVITILIAGVYIALDRFSTPKLEQSAGKGRFKEGASIKAIRIARLCTALIGVLVLVVVWGIEFDSMLIFASTTVTLIGVAFFASWSILSNITAHFVILLNPSFKRGTFVRILDADNYAEGYISELTIFSTKLVTENREVIVYPNNLLLGRPALINPRNRLNGVGKLPAHAKAGASKVADA